MMKYASLKPPLAELRIKSESRFCIDQAMQMGFVFLLDNEERLICKRARAALQFNGFAIRSKCFLDNQHREGIAGIIKSFVTILHASCLALYRCHLSNFQ